MDIVTLTKLNPLKVKQSLAVKQNLDKLHKVISKASALLITAVENTVIRPLLSMQH